MTEKTENPKNVVEEIIQIEDDTVTEKTKQQEDPVSEEYKLKLDASTNTEKMGGGFIAKPGCPVISVGVIADFQTTSAEKCSSTTCSSSHESASRVLYGSETWSLTLREGDRRSVFKNKILKRVFGPRRYDNDNEAKKRHHTKGSKDGKSQHDVQKALKIKRYKLQIEHFKLVNYRTKLQIHKLERELGVQNSVYTSNLLANEY